MIPNSHTPAELVRLQNPSAARRSLQILIAEDSSLMRKMLGHLLETRGHDVVLVQNGREALEELPWQDFDLLLTDVDMPLFNGLETAATIRAVERFEETPPLPILGMIPFGDEELEQACEHAEMDGWITKPVQRSLLVTLVEDLTNLAEQRRRDTRRIRISQRDFLTTAGLLANERPRILVAGGHPISRELVVSLLSQAGCDIVPVSSGPELLEKGRTERFDLAWIDAQLPLFEGVQAAVVLRKLSCCRSLPVVLCGNTWTECEVEQFLEAKVDGLCRYPIEPDDLLETVAKLLKQSRVQTCPASVPADDMMISEQDLLDRVNGDRELLAALVESFESELPELLNDLEQAVADRNEIRLLRVFSNIRETVGTFASALPDRLCRRLEQAAQERDWDAVDVLLPAISVVLQELVSHLHHTLHCSASGEPPFSLMSVRTRSRFSHATP